ncbi:hypothetical protein M441DRAFT_84984 [Trichoderma asperellum CBS 433.97]|uniref:ABM domain-containing protein n=1 Tax=Trichoderma asperellum (strain ATCC 204424 / CBS 433.97 / NBRC 101777) TaxID=1042311 RepID=A0A2T3YQW9_TRIA4|nr:hypothetical protein M441DRAFT_84984 [Trichoderma asperellum CBS 433.97]PTB34958.1 hypothetical protein M441DRAFT_84984 [Trichoderma asperellum CBS 433.97]WVH32741.1 leucine rich repeat protein [Trichoderma asperellum]
MSITELVFITVQPDPQVRKELNMKLPDALRGVFSGLPKLESLYIASNFGLLGEDGGSHDDICLLLKWQDISGFDSFIKSTDFAAFKRSILPYLTGPADIQLYESLEDVPVRMAVDSPHLHIMRSHPNVANIQTGRISRTSFEDRWKDFIEQCRLALSAKSSLIGSFNGLGLRKEDSAFFGATLWKDRESINSTLSDSAVNQHLQRLQEVTGTNNWVHFLMKIDQVALDK